MKNINMTMPGGGKSEISVNRIAAFVDLRFVRAGMPSVGVRLPASIAQTLVKCLQAELADEADES